MSATKRVTSWTTGINNVADPDALPVAKVSYNSTANVRSGARHVAAATNIDFLTDGTICSRLKPAVTKANARGTRMLVFKNEVIFAFAYGGGYHSVVAMDAADLLDPTFLPDVADELKILVDYSQLQNGGSYVTDLLQCGARLGEELFFFTTDGQGWRYDGVTIRTWGVYNGSVFPQIAVRSAGGFPAGRYRLCMTRVDDYGQESPVSTITEIDQAAPFRISPSFISGVKFYMTAPEGETFYEVTPSFAGELVGADVFMEGKRLEHQFCISPPMGEMMIAYNGVILIASGNLLTVTLPFRPHLCDPTSGFFQFPEEITNIIEVADGVFITADKTYFLRGVETDSPDLTKVFDEPAVKSSATRISESAVVWMTKFGFVVAADGGKAEFAHRDSYLPPNVTEGKTGRFARNKQLLMVHCNRPTLLPGFRPVSGD